MKKILVIALLTPLFLAKNIAQVSFGFKSGVNFGTAHTTDLLDKVTPNFHYSPGWNVGAVTEISFGRYFAVQPEINWVQKGFAWNESTGIPIGQIEIPIGATATFRTNYVEVPLLAKLKLGNDRVQAYVVAGPAFGYALNGKIITRPHLFFDFNPIRTNLNLDNLNYERFEVSATGGLGVQFNLNGVKLFADARYTRGFTDLYNFPVVNEKIQNRGVALSAGLLFDLAQPAPKKVPTRRPILRH